MELLKEYNYKDIMQEIQGLKRRFASEIEVESIGITNENRCIPMLVFGSGRKKAVFTGGVHARESINSIVLLAMAELYLERKNTLYRNKGQIYLIPLLNPDGYEKARTKDFLWKGNGKGVDINRNFPSVHFSEKWKGDRAGSEEETRALMQVFYDIKPNGYIDYHSRGKSIYYHRMQMNAKYNEEQLRIGALLAKSTGYRLENPLEEIEISDSGGNTVHFFSEYFEKPAITIETVSEDAYFPLPTPLQKTTFEEIKHTFETFLDAL